MMPLQQAAEKAGITYRQAHYWVSTKRFRGQWFAKNGDPVEPEFAGSGFECWIDATETEVMRVTGLLLKAGFQLDAAVRTARLLPQHGAGAVDLGPGLVLLRSAGPLLEEQERVGTDG
jgi:hypothetical protein